MHYKNKQTLFTIKRKGKKMRTIDKNTILDFSNHLMWAQADAKEVAVLNNEDGGSCNFDTVVINTKGVPVKILSEVTNLTGIRIEKVSGRFWRGYSFIYFDVRGQGNLRTRMTETAYNTLKELGYEVNMFYELD